MIQKNIYTPKKKIERESGLPSIFPFKCYYPAKAIPADEPDILVGMDSGVSNTAFAYVELIRDTETGAVIDFKFGDAYYFLDELNTFVFQMDKQLYLAEQYFNLFGQKRVLSLTYELLSLHSTKDATTLKCLIDTQGTTDIIRTLAYILNHYYIPVPAKSIKYCFTGNGEADKTAMSQTAYKMTGDERLLVNNHMADAFAMCFYAFIQKVKEDCTYRSTPIPEKYAYMDWNFKSLLSTSYKK